MNCRNYTKHRETPALKTAQTCAKIRTERVNLEINAVPLHTCRGTHIKRTHFNYSQQRTISRECALYYLGEHSRPTKIIKSRYTKGICNEILRQLFCRFFKKQHKNASQTSTIFQQFFLLLFQKQILQGNDKSSSQLETKASLWQQKENAKIEKNLPVNKLYV